MTMALKDSFVEEVLPYIITVFLGLTILISFIINMKIRNIMNNKLKFTIFARMFTIQFIVLDCFAALFIFIPSAIVSSALSWILTDYVCKAHGIIITWIYLVTFGLLSVRNIERMYKLRFPDSYQSKFGSKGKLTVVFVLVWVIDLGVACIPLTEWTLIKYDYHHSSCVPDLETNIYHLMVIIGFGIGVTSIVFLFTNIIIYNTNEKKKNTSNTTNADADETNRKDPAYISKRQNSNVSVNNWVGSNHTRKNDKLQGETLSRPPSYNSWLKNETKSKDDEKKKMISWSEFRHATTTNFALCIIMLLFFVPYFALVIARAICGSCIHKSEVSATLVFVVLTFTIRPILTYQRLCRVIKSKEEKKMNRRRRKRFTNINNSPEGTAEKPAERKDSLFDEGFDETEFGEFNDDLHVPRDTDDQTLVKTKAGLVSNKSANKSKYNKENDKTETVKDEDSPWESECDIFLSDDDTDEDESGNKIKKTLLLGGSAAVVNKENEKSKKNDKNKKETSKQGKQENTPDKNSKNIKGPDQRHQENEIIENKVVTVVVINKHTSNKTENESKNTSQGKRKSNDEIEKDGGDRKKNAKQTNVTKSTPSDSNQDTFTKSRNLDNEHHSHGVVKGIPVNKTIGAEKGSNSNKRRSSDSSEGTYKQDEKAAHSQEKETKREGQGNNHRRDTEDEIENVTSVVIINRNQHQSKDTSNSLTHAQKSNVTVNEIHNTTVHNEIEHSSNLYENKTTNRKAILRTANSSTSNGKRQRQNSFEVDRNKVLIVKLTSDSLKDGHYDSESVQHSNKRKPNSSKPGDDGRNTKLPNDTKVQSNGRDEAEILGKAVVTKNSASFSQNQDTSSKRSNEEYTYHGQALAIGDTANSKNEHNSLKRSNEEYPHHGKPEAIGNTTYTSHIHHDSSKRSNEEHRDHGKTIAIGNTASKTYTQHNNSKRPYEESTHHSQDMNIGNTAFFPHDQQGSTKTQDKEHTHHGKAMVNGNTTPFSHTQHSSYKGPNEKRIHNEKYLDDYSNEYINDNQNSKSNDSPKGKEKYSETGMNHRKTTLDTNTHRNGLPNSTLTTKGKAVAAKNYDDNVNESSLNTNENATKRNRSLLNVNHVNYDSSSMQNSKGLPNSGKDILSSDVRDSRDKRYPNDSTWAYHSNNNHNVNHTYKDMHSNDTLPEINHVNKTHYQRQKVHSRRYSHNQPSDRLTERTIIHSKSDDNIVINQNDGLPKYDSTRKTKEELGKPKLNKTETKFALDDKISNASEKDKEAHQSTGVDASNLAVANIEEKSSKEIRSTKPKEVIRFDPYSVTEPLKTVKLWNKATANVNAINALAKLNKFQALHGQNPQ